MHPQFEDEIKIEHLQGFLYVQQLVKNMLSPSGGSMNEYSITIIEKKQENLNELLVNTILNRLKFNTKIEKKHFDFLMKEARFFPLENWTFELSNKLEEWFVDNHIQLEVTTTETQVPILKSMSIQERTDWLKEYKTRAENINKNFKQYKPCTSSFINLIRNLLGIENIEVFEFHIEYEKKQHKNYLWHYMNMYWGMWFNIFLIKKGETLMLLHLGRIIT